MFEINVEGRVVRVRPQGAVWSQQDGWIELDRIQAKSLVEKIVEHRVWENDESEPEDG